MKELDLAYKNIHKLISTRNQKITNSIPKQITKETSIQIDTENSLKEKHIYLMIIDENSNIIKKTDKFIGTIKQLDKSKNIKQITFITKQALSKTLIKKIPLLVERKSILESILYAELMFCMLEHKNMMQCTYSIVSDSHYNAFYGSDKGLKYILLDDPSCIWYNFHKNQIIEVTYPSNVSGFITEQRKVISKTISGRRIVIYPKEAIEEEVDEELEEAEEEEEESIDEQLMAAAVNPDNINL